MRSRSGLSLTLALGLPLLLIFSLLAFVVMTQPDKGQCAAADVRGGGPTAPGATPPYIPGSTPPGSTPPSTPGSPSTPGWDRSALAQLRSITVQVGGQPVTLGTDQIAIAAVVIAEGKALGVPERGWVVALAAAGAESGIRNLNSGDRDSVGPWQMRPSSGWGTVQQIRNVQYAARAFFGMAGHSPAGLMDVAGWQQMTIAQAAQAVERSAFPDAYTKWESAAQSIVDQLANGIPAGAAPGCDTAGSGQAQGTGPAGATGPVRPGAWHIPVGKPYTVGCGFGCYSGHTGQDFPAPVGTPVYALNSGTIVKSESITPAGSCTTLPICGRTRISYGNLVVIQLAGGGDATAWYAHLSARAVRVGQTVQAGQLIGAVGFEGHVLPPGPAGAHLHFEIRIGGTPIDPMPYLRSKGIHP